MEIIEKGRTYIVKGDYPNGKYAKFIKPLPIKAPALTDAAALSDAEFRKIVLEKLGIKCK